MKKKNYRFLFGPVPSRRLGISLGVDLVPHKICSLNCIYCECGATTSSTINRREYVSTAEVVSELRNYLDNNPQLDFITFSGSGEPTLHSGIGEILTFVNTNYPDYKTALITNASLFHLKEVRDEVKNIDVLLPSLDAASETVFNKINRPHHNLKIQSIIEGLAIFNNNFAGKIWLEIFIVKGLNDSDSELKQLREAIHKIRPERIQINTLDRPGTEQWVEPVSAAELELVLKKLDWNGEIIARFHKKKQPGLLAQDVKNAIVQLIKRRPCTAEDLASSLGMNIREVNKYINALIDQDIIQIDNLERGIFYRLKDSEKVNLNISLSEN
ncbi:radical SAM protein [candidate division KSB1 bacterium]|nr:radical SAM protein [candidate division KSB1 bacterium]